MLIDFSTTFNRYDDSMLEDQHVSKNVAQLTHSIDSVKVVSKERSREQSTRLVSNRYFGRENGRVAILPTAVTKEEKRMYNIDSLWAALTPGQHRRVLATAEENARVYKDQIDYHALLLEDADRYIRKHEIELHRKFTLAFACLVFFFIGAPLGTIIRKGGLGAPVVISVILFIIYYIIDNTGYKMAREALWPCWAGMWLSSFVLLPTGIFLTYKAATDAPLFNPEVWTIKLKHYFYRVQRKDK